jgi:MFS family permease
MSIVCTAALLPGDTHLGAQVAERRLGPLSWGAYAGFFRRPELSRLLLQFSCFYFSFALFVGGFALFAERRFRTSAGLAFGPKEVGYVFAYAGLLGVLLQGGLIGRLVKRFGESRLVVVGFTSSLVGYAGLALASTVPQLLAVTTVSSLGSGMLRPCLSSLISRRAGRHEQGVTMGLSQSLNSLAQIVAPLAAGLLIGRGALVAWALAAGASSLTGLLLSRRAR